VQGHLQHPGNIVVKKREIRKVPAVLCKA